MPVNDQQYTSNSSFMEWLRENNTTTVDMSKYNNHYPYIVTTDNTSAVGDSDNIIIYYDLNSINISPRVTPDISSTNPFTDTLIKAKRLSCTELDMLILELIRFKKLNGSDEIG